MTITDYHRAIFDYLEAYRAEHPETNLTYWLRSKNSEDRPRNLYLFTGAENYISVGLYMPLSNVNKVRSINLSFAYDQGQQCITACSLELAYNDPKLASHKKVYEVIIDQIGREQFRQLGGRDKYQLPYTGENWQTNLQTYLSEHKPIIDKIIEEQGLSTEFFIPQNVFDGLVKSVQPKQHLDERVKSLLQRQQTRLSNHPKNSILYGPPGTGKTFETISLAVEIIDGERSDEHRENKVRFDELREAKQIEFVTFHQNYTYEDFVVGIRPDTTAGTLMFEPSYGIFYNIADRARANYKQSKEPNAALAQRPFDEVFAELIEPLVDRDEPVAIRMAKGKTFEMTAVSDRNIDFEKSNGSTIHALSIATLKRAYEGLQEIRSDGLGVYYRPLVQKLWEMGKQTDVNSSTWSEHPQRYVLIIDEINRANMSRVFGELITLLEDDKRLGEENALTVTLPNGELFNVPPNLYIVGTMNTADKSLALLDVALRRRFEFIGKYPQPSLLSAEAKPLLERLNKAIFQEKRSTDFLIGHAYFMGKSPLEAVMSKRVFPLLMEYFGGNQSRVEKLLQDADIPFHADPVTYQLCYGSATSH